MAKPGTRRSPRPERYTPAGFITFAEDFGTAAFHAYTIDLKHDGPIGALACHSMELSLKAVLLSKGATADEVVSYRHDLTRLFQDSGLDWSDIDPEAIAFYAEALDDQGFRYRDSDRPYVLEPTHILEMMSKIFHRCLETVFPGAKRTLQAPRPRRRLSP
jgi:hypothetical protein